MPRTQSKRTAVSTASMRARMERAYLEWKKYAGYHSWIIGRDLAFAPQKCDLLEKSLSSVNLQLRRDVNAAFDEFDRAIVQLVERDKTAIGDPRILERISQAQHLGDKKFFKGLSVGLASNVGIDERLKNRDDFVILLKCALAYLEGNEKLIKEEYEHWKNLKPRREKPNDAKFQALLRFANYSYIKTVQLVSRTQ